MAKKKISGLPAGSALNGTELVPIVQTGTTKRITTQDIANLGNASGVEGSGTINNLAKFTASSTIGNSKFFDDGTNQGIETTTAVNRFIMSANASIAKIFSFRSANLPRWAFRVDGTESGSNAGADFAIRRYNDAGTFLDSPLSFTRSSGAATFSSSVGVGGITNGRLGVRGTTNDSSAYAFEAANLSGATLFIVRNDGASIFSAGLSLNSATAPASGIEFPATQVASASANNLDDYEEGTWTMGISFDGASTGIVYSENIGNYVKIGKQVTATGYLTLSSKGSSTGIAKITGLPFLVGGSTGNYSAPSFWFDDISFTNQYQGYGNIGETTIDLRQISLLGADSAITNTDFANNSRLMVTLTYFV